MTAQMDSIILETAMLPAVRAFYETSLGLRINMLDDKRGMNREDCSIDYVNYRISPGVLLCFEQGKVASVVTIVLRVHLEVAERLGALQGKTSRNLPDGHKYMSVQDPEARKLILEYSSPELDQATPSS
jgi:hypothetical protein